MLDRTVRAQLARLYGTPTDDWELLAVHHDPEAVPAMPPPHDLRRPVRLLSGLYVCGDHRDTNTVQGALFSGRRAAHAILRDLGVRPAYGRRSCRRWRSSPTRTAAQTPVPSGRRLTSDGTGSTPVGRGPVQPSAATRSR